MSAVQPFYLSLKMNKLNHQKLSKTEILILEGILFINICEEIKEMMRQHNKDYFQLLKFNLEKENYMIEANFFRSLVNDILSTDEYNLFGIAYYTNTPEDVIYEIATGKNNNPTFVLSRKLIELHRNVKPNLYREIINKITTKEPFEES